MSVTLYTQEELEAFTTRVSCCASNQAYKALKAKRAGSSQYKCIYNKHLYLQQALCILEDYKAIGSVLTPGVSPHAAIAAFVVLDFSIFNNNGTFLNTFLEIDGVSAFDTTAFTNTFYGDIDSFGTALQNAINAWTAFNGGYTAVYDNVLNTFTITAPTAGVTYNGVPVLITIRQDRFYEWDEIPSASPLTGQSDGCYATLSNEVLFTNFINSNIQLFTEGATIGTGTSSIAFDGLAPAYTARYNPTLDHIYIFYYGGGVRIFDTGYNILGFLNPVDVTLSAVKDAIIVQEGINTMLWYTSFGDGVVRKSDVTSSIAEGSPILTDIALPIGSTPYGIAQNPVDGTIWVADVALNEVYSIHPTTFAVTTMGLNLTAGLNVIDLNFISNNGTWELWIVGSGESSVDIFDATTVTVGSSPIDNINLTGTNIQQIENFVQHSNGYVYGGIITGEKSVFIADPTTRNIMNTTTIVTIYNPDNPVENLSTGKMYIGESQGYLLIVEFERLDFNLDNVLSGGEDAVIEEIPTVYVTEDDGTNCLTQDEMYVIIENVKKICGCCCEFDDDVLQRDIS